MGAFLFDKQIFVSNIKKNYNIMEILESLQEGVYVLLVTKPGVLIKGTVKSVSKEKKMVTLEEDESTKRVEFLQSGNGAVYRAKTVEVDFDFIGAIGIDPT